MTHPTQGTGSCSSEPCNSQDDNPSSTYVSQGMPTLDMTGKQTSFFEFWPTWLMYLPVVIQSIFLAVRHRSLTLPLIANPKLPLSGMVGVAKSELLNQAQGDCKETILPWFLHNKTAASLDAQVQDLVEQIDQHGYGWPVVCKPDIGCRGSGVKLVHNPEQLAAALDHYPEGASVMIQHLASWEPEAGVFYVRNPKEPNGRIISLALKYTPYVVGDGHSTLQQLIDADPRASQLKHLYLSRHADKLNTVVAADEPYRLIFAASHSKGAIFRDAKEHITPELTQRIDSLMKDLPDFYYGRLDIKFRDLDSLKQGENIQIVEINSASSESLHIWDRETSFGEAVRSLLFQYRTLFELGSQNRKRGFSTPALRELLAAWKKERQLTQLYPETD